MTCIAPKCRAAPTPGAVFCDQHMKATAWARGGWLSAYRRRVAMVQQHEGSTMTLDASNIAPGLWMGGKPPFDRAINVDILVLCAYELQPRQIASPCHVVRVPLHDDVLPMAAQPSVLRASAEVANALVSKRRVLVTCYAGMNRSGLITALALGRVTKLNAGEIIHRVRERRGINGVLSNPSFVAFIEQTIAGWRSSTPKAPR